MNSASMTERERRLLSNVASEYEMKGYQVKLLPTGEDLPSFLAGLQPDLIVTGRGESVVVEVKSRKEIEGDQDVAAIEAAVRDRAGWRFELVIDGSNGEQGTVLAFAQIESALEEANQLRDGGHMVAALLLLWSATEGILRLLASHEGVELESSAPGYVTKHLYTLGLLGREQFRILEGVLQLRNQAAHGFQTSVTGQQLTDVSVVARQLLGELRSQAA